MGNLAGIAATLNCLVKPQLLVPTVLLPDIRAIDWRRIKDIGYNGVVIDKDNCITKPHEDKLVPELHDAWKECLATFGSARTLIVSNSAGTADDPALIQAESVARQLGAPVLVHAHKKPSHRVVCAIESFFAPPSGQQPVPVIYPPFATPTTSPGHQVLPSSPPKLIVIGDRVMTDIVLASRLRTRLRSQRPPQSAGIFHTPVPGSPSAVGSVPAGDPVYAVLTRTLWQREKLGTKLMRWAENRASQLIIQHLAAPAQPRPQIRVPPLRERLLTKYNQLTDSITALRQLSLPMIWHAVRTYLGLSFSRLYGTARARLRASLTRLYTTMSIRLRALLTRLLSTLRSRLHALLTRLLSSTRARLILFLSNASARTLQTTRQILFPAQTFFKQLSPRAFNALSLGFHRRFQRLGLKPPTNAAPPGLDDPKKVEDTNLH